MSGAPDPEGADEDAEEMADADLEALDAMAEALLDAIIQAGREENPQE